MGLTPTELSQIIARVQRAMPRNADVMAICDELAGRLRIAAPPMPTEKIVEAASAMLAGPGFDRKAYMRDYMRKKRKAK